MGSPGREAYPAKLSEQDDSQRNDDEAGLRPLPYRSIFDPHYSGSWVQWRVRMSCPGPGCQPWQVDRGAWCGPWSPMRPRGGLGASAACRELVKSDLLPSRIVGVMRDHGEMTIGIVVQTVAVLVALFGLWRAHRIALADRRAADRRAEDDRRSTDQRATEDRRLARLEAERRFQLDLLIRLSQNLERGGATDAHERARLAAEAGALLSALGPHRLPLSWEIHRKRSLDEARAYMLDASNADWRRCANEVALELDRVAGASAEARN